MSGSYYLLSLADASVAELNEEYVDYFPGLLVNVVHSLDDRDSLGTVTLNPKLSEEEFLFFLSLEPGTVLEELEEPDRTKALNIYHILKS